MKITNQIAKSLGFTYEYNVELNALIVAEWVKDLFSVDNESDPIARKEYCVLFSELSYKDEYTQTLNRLIEHKMSEFILTNTGQATPKMIDIAKSFMSVTAIGIGNEGFMISIWVYSGFKDAFNLRMSQ